MIMCTFFFSIVLYQIHPAQAGKTLPPCVQMLCMLLSIENWLHVDLELDPIALEVYILVSLLSAYFHIF